MAYARRFDALFPRTLNAVGEEVHEVPEPMLALVATAVCATSTYTFITNLISQLYCAIHEWRTGTHQSIKFTSDAFLDVYNGNIYTLNNIKTKRPRAFHLMMADVYSLAR